jgi:hypothetical protein
MTEKEIYRAACRLLALTADGHAVINVPAMPDQLGTTAVDAKLIPEKTVAQFRRGATTFFYARVNLDAQRTWELRVEGPFEHGQLVDPNSAVARELGSPKLLGFEETETWAAEHQKEIDALPGAASVIQKMIVCHLIVDGYSDRNIRAEAGFDVEPDLLDGARRLLSSTLNLQ